ncbi:hypothetical protein Rfer_4333 (plasmid) [Rhodoferax ferrireducens T118]|uniref:Uncharacterized protein n=1 Tax=Albidiferax ferrireducens (strain ATCC BAA-621 / DSM 15236 / T118) TaxID=338969 RepID=Q21QC6_ALBFT|nr:hypothetical protein [Rhodoferax ferrireducens]ABD72019.1 hypothetical protein Rfer_4333 [Rhodoferax ferrireducens T118]
MKTRELLAVNLFGSKDTPLAQFFKLSIMAAMAARVMEGDMPLQLQHGGTAQIAFYPCETLLFLVCPALERVPRLIVNITPHSAVTNQPAEICIEVELVDVYAPLIIKVIFPDQIFGMERLLAGSDKTLYRGFYFNTTPGAPYSNLFSVLNSVSLGFSVGLTAHLQEEKELFKTQSTAKQADADAATRSDPPKYEADQADQMVPCALCKWPEATHAVPFCPECLRHVAPMTRQDEIQAQLATQGLHMERSLSALDGEGHAIMDISTGEMVEEPAAAVIALAEEWSVLEGMDVDDPSLLSAPAAVAWARIKSKH